jgi:hypothetical protein
MKNSSHIPAFKIAVMTGHSATWNCIVMTLVYTPHHQRDWISAIDASQHLWCCFVLNFGLVVLAQIFPFPLPNREHHHSIKAPSAGEGADRGET